MVGASLILPILPLYAQDEFGLSPQAITLLVSSFFAAQFLAGPYLGRLSDRIGRVPVLIVSQIGTVIAFIALGLAQSAWMLFAARILDGLTGGNIIVAQAYITDVSPPEKRSQALGTVLAAFGIAFVVGPAVGGLALRFMGPRFPYILAAIAALATLALTWFTLDESLPDRGSTEHAAKPRLSWALVWTSATIPLLLLLGFLAQAVLGLVISTFALFGGAVLFTDWDPGSVGLGVGLILTVVGLSQLVTQLSLIDRLLQRLGELRLIKFGLVVRATGLAVIGLTASPIVAAIGSAAFACGTGLTVPPTQSVATKAVDDRLRGGMLGLFQSVSSLGTILSTALGGVLFAVDPFLPIRAAALLALVALIPAGLLTRRFDQQHAAT